uniref:Uncharacterized protein n=1 Tax=Anguilla anguilla TaxID=7936 RepID=A0A0E9U1C1_ANGAN
MSASMSLSACSALEESFELIFLNNAGS